MKRSLTFRYTLHQMAYWAAAAGIMSFASAFLLEKGFTASQVGVLLASGSLLSGIFQPVLAGFADRVGGAVLPRMAIGLTLICGAFFAALLLLPLPMWLFGLLYLLGIFTYIYNEDYPQTLVLSKIYNHLLSFVPYYKYNPYYRKDYKMRLLHTLIRSFPALAKKLIPLYIRKTKMKL